MYKIIIYRKGEIYLEFDKNGKGYKSKATANKYLNTALKYAQNLAKTTSDKLEVEMLNDGKISFYITI